MTYNVGTDLAATFDTIIYAPRQLGPVVGRLIVEDLAPMYPCKCGREWPSRGAKSNHIRYHSPQCRSTPQETGRLWRERHPERSRQLAAVRGARYALTPKGKIHRQWKAPPEKIIAKSAVQIAVDSGRLVKRPCEVCGVARSHGHHYLGYAPEHRLDVVWLCAIHHAAAHKAMREATSTEEGWKP